jgi:hypothetical protein
MGYRMLPYFIQFDFMQWCMDIWLGYLIFKCYAQYCKITLSSFAGVFIEQISFECDRYRNISGHQLR